MEENLPPSSPLPKLTKPSFWRKRRRLLIIIALVLVLVGGMTWYVTANTKQSTTEDAPVTKKEEKPVISYSLTNGIQVSSDVANRHPVAVMIENSPAARPQAGLINADIVYEAVTEGGITRFMGIFSQDFPAKAGPVRSARSYFIDYLSEYDAFYAHAGGSPTALSRIGEYGIKDYPHSSDAYWREAAAGVASEHTLFTDVSKIYKFGVEKKKWPATFDTKTWLFKDPAATTTATGTLNIDFSSPGYKVAWKYDPTTNSYNREMAGSIHKDRTTGEQIKVRNVVIIRVPHSANAPYKGTGKESEWTMSTIGSGEASVFIDGTQVKGTWKKPSRTERTRFYDEAGTEVTLNRGKIWVEVVPQEGSYTFTP